MIRADARAISLWTYPCLGALMYAFLHSADEARRRQGFALERLGYGPVTTPSRTVRSSSIADLLAYQDPRADRPVALLVPAPIKAYYIWDLDRAVSVVQRLLHAGLQVYLMRWQPPPAEGRLGLAVYADAAIAECVDALRAETGQERVLLAGHSLGGTLAAIFASLHPERVRALLELEGPIEFGEGMIEALLAAAPRTSVASVEGDARVPGTYLDVASLQADPLTFAAEPWLDLLASTVDPDGRRLHLQVRRWTLDEMPMAGPLLDEVANRLYRDNAFAEGRLEIGGRVAAPGAITAPVLAVLDPRSRIVPPSSVEAYRSRTASKDVRILAYTGDSGVVLQHVGVLVGRNAHRVLWPQIAAWVQSMTH
jgi:polyhydroxyalkanoate synthase subunit PhaC